MLSMQILNKNFIYDIIGVFKIYIKKTTKKNFTLLIYFLNTFYRHILIHILIPRLASLPS